MGPCRTRHGHNGCGRTSTKSRDPMGLDFRASKPSPATQEFLPLDKV